MMLPSYKFLLVHPLTVTKTTLILSTNNDAECFSHKFGFLQHNYCLLDFSHYFDVQFLDHLIIPTILSIS